MGLLRFQRFSKTPTFIRRFFKQKEEKEEFSPNEKEFSAKQRTRFSGHIATGLLSVTTLVTIPGDSYGFLTNLSLMVSSSTIDFGDASIAFGLVILGAETLIRLIPPIDSTGGKFANSDIVYNHPIKISPGHSIFLDNLVAQRASATVIGFLVPKKEIDREIIDKYG